MKKSVIALAITATASMALAAPGAYGARHRGGKAGMERLAQKLGLSEAQKEQIKAIHKADFEKNKQLYTDFRTKRQEYRQLEQANDPRAEEVKAQLQSMKDQVKTARQATHEQVLNVLTAEQRQQLEQRRSERGPRRQQ